MGGRSSLHHIVLAQPYPSAKLGHASISDLVVPNPNAALRPGTGGPLQFGWPSGGRVLGQDHASGVAPGPEGAHGPRPAPLSFHHVQWPRDFGHGLLPFIAFAAIAGIAVPIAESLFKLADALVGANYRASGRTAETMGIAGLDRRQLISLVTI